MDPHARRCNTGSTRRSDARLHVLWSECPRLPRNGDSAPRRTRAQPSGNSRAENSILTLQLVVGPSDPLLMAIQRSRRLTRLALRVVVLASAVTAGCGALEELDKAAALLETSDPTQSTAAEENKPRGLDWSNVKSINTGKVDPSITQCTIGGAVTFTRSDDCLAQGGKPARI